MVVHGEQKVELHKPLPTFGTFTAEGRTIGAFDKGKDKGAVIVNETVWTDEKGEKVATLTGSTFAAATRGSAGPRKASPNRTRSQAARRTSRWTSPRGKTRPCSTG